MTLLAPERDVVEARPTENMEAYRAFLQARYLATVTDWFTEETLLLRLEHLERALELDPELAPAWSDLAETHGQLYKTGYDKSPERREMTREAMNRAVELAPDAFSAHMDRAAFLYSVDRSFDRVLEIVAIAEKDRPNDFRMLNFKVSALRRLGRFQEAAEIGSAFRRLDPLGEGREVIRTHLREGGWRRRAAPWLRDLGSAGPASRRP